MIYLVYVLKDKDTEKNYSKPLFFENSAIATRYLVSFLDSNFLTKFKDKFELIQIGSYDTDNLLLSDVPVESRPVIKYE